MTNPIPQDVITAIDRRFSVGNNYQVQGTMVTIDEWNLVKAELQRARQVVPESEPFCFVWEGGPDYTPEFCFDLVDKPLYPHSEYLYKAPQPPTQQATHQQIHNAALEKAAQAAEWCTETHNQRDQDIANNAARRIRALMQQPIEQEKDKS